MSSVQQCSRTGASWLSYLGLVPDLYSDALTNAIGTNIYERVYASVHLARDYGILKNGRPLVIPIPVLPVDLLAAARILVLLLLTRALQASAYNQAVCCSILREH